MDIFYSKDEKKKLEYLAENGCIDAAFNCTICPFGNESVYCHEHLAAQILAKMFLEMGKEE
jgi:hypothetical protein